MIKTEATGRTVDDAVANALKELNLTKDCVKVTVLHEGGLFSKAKVLVEKLPSDDEKVKDFLENVLEKMGFDNFVVESEENEDRIAVNIIGAGKGNVIGYHGETLDALQYLASLVVNSKEGYRRVVVDSEGYRAKREESLTKLAKSLEQKVRRSGKAFKLEPMNPYERRIIHTALQDSKYVSTESEGTANGRHIIVSPKLTGDILNAPVSRKSLNFVYRSDKKKRR